MEQETPQQQNELKPNQLPTSYVMWLTIRSKFLDQVTLEQPELFERYKEFENDYLNQLEQNYVAQQINGA